MGDSLNKKRRKEATWPERTRKKKERDFLKAWDRMKGGGRYTWSDAPKKVEPAGTTALDERSDPVVQKEI